MKLIRRHDLRVSRAFERELFELNISQKSLFVFLVCKHKEPVDEALELVLSDDALDKADWPQVDAFSLDGSKTFVNGRCFL